MIGGRSQHQIGSSPAKNCYLYLIKILAAAVQLPQRSAHQLGSSAAGMIHRSAPKWAQVASCFYPHTNQSLAKVHHLGAAQICKYTMPHSLGQFNLEAVSRKHFQWIRMGMPLWRPDQTGSPQPLPPTHNNSSLSSSPKSEIFLNKAHWHPFRCQSLPGIHSVPL